MKKIWFTLVCLSALLAVISGCSRKDEEKSATAGKSGVEVTVKGGGKFPEFLAGTWESETQTDQGSAQWQFVFTSDGRISSVIDSWQEVLHANQTTDFNMPDGKSYITAGEFSIEYRPAQRELAVRIDLKDIHIFLPGLLVDANSSDYFTGPVSEDGNTWTAERMGIFSFSDQPMDPNDIRPDEDLVVFKKVQPQAAVADSNEKH
jgi:hypothetical protein